MLATAAIARRSAALLRPARAAASAAAARTYSAAAVKPNIKLLGQLRKDVEGVPITLAKQALVASNNDLAAAIQWLNDHAAATGAKKAAKVEGRVAKDGLVGVIDAPSGAAMVEVNAETDFVARNPLFLSVVHRLAMTAHVLEAANATTTGSVVALNVPEFAQAPLLPARDATAEAAAAPQQSVRDAIVETIGKVGENVTLRRGALVATAKNQVAGAYVHGEKALRDQGLGKMGAVAVLQANGDAKLTGDHAKLARQIAQIVVGYNPPTPRELDAAPFVFATPFFQADGVEDVTVAKVLGAAKVSVRDYVRFEVGEGIEKAEEDFAAEVQKQLGQQ
ncbi:hypothetical protein AMAG_01740 [Allomyces macrogynus ATCC 38327]|uniref:Elongation factor Ts, mitochondrial n=1 Tax=Allomyces macrogynus (strain ATCC 38327) TaxID=578462 RepID=A0A0L0RZY1_ALLM3|nr:hypothetical protein AMAG_01740 [Allomyces macrogynus ATCC 38327]|eukprot:KNE55873.1 hypothetical protein AMAG_01740 [Allomyces macrogynus ATCC 38327]